MSGWKDWAVGEVVTEGEFQSFVQDQVVQVYADSTARGSALGTAVAEGMVSYLEDTNLIEVYDGSAWINFTGDITGVTAGTALTGGGTAGNVTLDVDLSAITIGPAQVTGTAVVDNDSRLTDARTPTAHATSHESGGSDALTLAQSQITDLVTDLAGKQAVVAGVSDTEIGYLDGVTSAIQTQLDSKQSDVVTTQGDLIVGDAVGDASRLALGTATQVLTSNGTTAVWADASGGGGGGDITAVTAGTALTGGGTTGDVTLDVNLAAITIPVSQISDLTATAAELNILDGVTATAAELNVLDGITATTAELNYVDGVTSAIQTQLDGKVDEVDGSVTTATAGSAVVRNITLSTATPTGGSDGDVWLVYTA